MQNATFEEYFWETMDSTGTFTDGTVDTSDFAPGDNRIIHGLGKKRKKKKKKKENHTIQRRPKVELLTNVGKTGG